MSTSQLVQAPWKQQLGWGSFVIPPESSTEPGTQKETFQYLVNDSIIEVCYTSPEGNRISWVHQRTFTPQSFVRDQNYPETQLRSIGLETEEEVNEA
jgi:hypothetical protein